MTEAPISPLRRRMIDDMTMRKFAPLRIPTISAGHSGLKSATCSD